MPARGWNRAGLGSIWNHPSFPQQPNQPHMVILIVILVLGFVGWALWYFLDRSFRTCAATKVALSLVESDVELMNQLGGPLKIGFWLSGSTNKWLGFSSSLAPRWRGVTSLSLPLEGSRTTGRLKVKLELKNGVWQPYSASIRIGDATRILIEGGGTKGWFKRLFARHTS